MQRFVKIISLKPGPDTVASYRKAHDEIWPEIVKGILDVGIETMDLYLYGHQVVMIMETADDIDVEHAMEKLAKLPRQAEWENFVAQFQDCEAGSTSDEKWHLMEKIFTLKK
ncbi:MAG: L-rhamnose mutarotase [Muribaculaceae bacterium]|nr:L-rhamnose mutarotase [Muribaculaceae bacterium]